MPSAIKTELTGKLFGKIAIAGEIIFPRVAIELIADFQLDFVAVGFQFRGVHCAGHCRQGAKLAGGFGPQAVAQPSFFLGPISG